VRLDISDEVWSLAHTLAVEVFPAGWDAIPETNVSLGRRTSTMRARRSGGHITRCSTRFNGSLNTLDVERWSPTLTSVSAAPKAKD
jgi:hypothetical protein